MEFELEQRLGPLKIPYNKVPQMEASIGISGNDSSAGTLGSFVELYNVIGGRRTCALTCHHVVCSPPGLEINPAAPDFCESYIFTSFA